jgi:hypothetical protein
MNPYTGLDAPDTYDYIKQSPLKTMDNNFGQMTLGQGRHRGVSFLFFWGWWKSGEALSTHPIYIYISLPVRNKFGKNSGKMVPTRF